MADYKTAIKQKIGVTEILNLDDIAKINQFVFSIVPCPLLSTMRTPVKAISNPQQYIRYFDCWSARKMDPSGCYGNWCGYHAHLLVALLKDVYGYKQCNVWGYGFKQIINHVAVMITWNGKKYTFDPYFGLYYTSKTTGEHLPFDNLKVLLQKQKFEEITVKFSEPGTFVKKLVMTKVGNSAETHEWDTMGSEEFYNHIIAIFKTHKSEEQLKARFGHKEHMALMLLT